MANLGCRGSGGKIGLNLRPKEVKVCPDADGVGGEIGGSVERPGVEGSRVGWRWTCRNDKVRVSIKGKGRSIKGVIRKRECEAVSGYEKDREYEGKRER